MEDMNEACECEYVALEGLKFFYETIVFIQNKAKKVHLSATWTHIAQ